MQKIIMSNMGAGSHRIHNPTFNILVMRTIGAWGLMILRLKQMALPLLMQPKTKTT